MRESLGIFALCIVVLGCSCVSSLSNTPKETNDLSTMYVFLTQEEIDLQFSCMVGDLYFELTGLDGTYSTKWPPKPVDVNVTFFYYRNSINSHWGNSARRDTFFIYVDDKILDVVVSINKFIEKLDEDSYLLGIELTFTGPCSAKKRYSVPVTLKKFKQVVCFALDSEYLSLLPQRTIILGFDNKVIDEN